MSPIEDKRERPSITFSGLGKPFLVFLVIVGLFDLGNSSDAFLVLRAQERGLSVVGILGMLVTFNLVYSLVSTPAGSLSDRVGRRQVIIGGWLAYAAIYLGFALARAGWQVWVLYGFYGVYYGLAYGTTKAMVADLVPAESARHGLRNVQCHHGPARSSGIAHCRPPVARGRQVAGIWTLGALPVWRDHGIAGRSTIDLVEAPAPACPIDFDK